METIRRPRRRARYLAASAIIPLCGAAQAESFTTLDGWQVSLDTTLSAGLSLRTSPVDYAFVGKINGGQARTPNADNGTLNFRDNPVTSAPLQITE